MEKREVLLDRTWSVVRDQWVANWKMVTHASDMAAKRGGYKSVAALRAGTTTNSEAPASSATTVSRANYDAVVEYAVALEAENLELRSVKADGASTISSLPDTVDAATTTTSSTTAAVIAEMKRAKEVQAVAHDAQISQLTALITVAAEGKAPSPAPTPAQGGGGCVFMNPAGTRRVRHPTPKGAMTTRTDRNGRAVRMCSSCTKNWVTHSDNTCLELPKNAAKRREDWKSYFM